MILSKEGERAEIKPFLLTKIPKTFISIIRLRMKESELVSAIATKADLSKKEAEAALKAFTEVVAEELVKGEKIQLVGFGTFEVSERAARTGRNPQTGKEMKIDASKAPKFKAGKALKDAVNN